MADDIGSVEELSQLVDKVLGEVNHSVTQKKLFEGDEKKEKKYRRLLRHTQRCFTVLLQKQASSQMKPDERCNGGNGHDTDGGAGVGGSSCDGHHAVHYVPKQQETPKQNITTSGMHLCRIHSESKRRNRAVLDF